MITIQRYDPQTSCDLQMTIHLISLDVGAALIFTIVPVLSNREGWVCVLDVLQDVGWSIALCKIEPPAIIP